MPNCSLNHQPLCPHDYCDLMISTASTFCRPAASSLLPTAVALAAAWPSRTFHTCAATATTSSSQAHQECALKDCVDLCHEEWCSASVHTASVNNIRAKEKLRYRNEVEMQVQVKCDADRLSCMDSPILPSFTQETYDLHCEH